MKTNQKGFTPLEAITPQAGDKGSNPLTGFTLVELIVVIAIIGILATIVLVGVTRYINKTRVAATEAKIDQITQALLLYKTENGCFPNPLSCSGSGSSLTCDCCPDDGDCVSEDNTVVVQLLINADLLGGGNKAFTDAWGRNYFFEFNWYYTPVGSQETCSVAYSRGQNGTDETGVWGFGTDCSGFFDPDSDDIGKIIEYSVGQSPF